ncbi:sigma-54-dependent Fis family transcriptional regulator [Rhodoferax sp.]|uniref:sigma-54-dependent Fis family transcriptional regulator n=1 Tax=Rhodoferax sp. TaxID=50421 RepID=UPI002626DA95|nr:sigma-54-dependent Fis family transcriptional regulator [Rhodoferax sp.]MDD5480414.1 sigma-54-dependent Fis family transcriptional regulator [Rhodoferax sp.]
MSGPPRCTGDNPLRTPPTAPALRQARLHFLEHGMCPPDGLDASVARSWQRSLAAGLLPNGPARDTVHTSAAELSRLMASQHELLVHSRPVMEVLFEQVQDSQSMVILANAQGILMHTLGRTDFLQRAQQVALSNGASWHEHHRGTNAIGTALAERSQIEIHGGEHFFERNDFLTCTAAPIVSATGQLMGVLDISGDYRGGHPHTYGLVSMAARLIENRLMGATCRQHIRLHLHPQREGIGTVAEGILALSGDGWVVGANRAALLQLGLTPADLGAVPVKTLLDVSLDALLQQHQRRPGQPLQVHRRDGTALLALVQHDAATQGEHGRVMRPAAAVAAPVLEPTADALAQLDTGDLRWRSAADKARRVAGKPIPLLIQGESGVGKELFARAVHESGPRRTKPFVAINCAAVPENLIEAELFGYAPGAFTGARREGSAGRLREAHGGTLFLDEIGDMPLPMQARLLRVLQERQVSPLGGGAAVAVDFALMCATHCKLREAAEQGRFRSDLYYRLNGLTVQLPPLRERTDFDELTRRLLADLNPGCRVHVAPALLVRLRQHAWPGNLRQYANALRTASAMLEPHEACIDWEHLSDDVQEDVALAAQVLQQPPQPAQDSAFKPTPPVPNLQELSQAAMRQALERNSGNVSQAARQLGISRQTLYRKLQA